MNQVGIVILNYKNYNETIQCVDSILNQKKVEMQIVIVDNGSENESVEKLQGKYSKFKEINIIVNTQNLGYARGNNIGIEYLRKIGFNFILVCNSDVIFSSELILYTMCEKEDDSVGVMIPIIKNLDGTIEMRAQYRSKFFPLRILKELKRMQNVSQENLLNKKALQKKMEFLKPGVQNNYYVITGSVFALTPAFFKYYKGLFPETFLYVEEIATMMMLYKARLKCAIVQTDDVIHKGAASTETDLKAGTMNKRMMVAKSARQVEKLVYLPLFLIRYKYGVRKK